MLLEEKEGRQRVRSQALIDRQVQEGISVPCKEWKNGLWNSVPSQQLLGSLLVSLCMFLVPLSLWVTTILLDIGYSMVSAVSTQIPPRLHRRKTMIL